MIVNTLLAALQRLQLHCKGLLPLRVFIAGKEYAVVGAAEYEDNVVLDVQEVQCENSKEM